MKELNFELGQWVGCSMGYGQVMYIRAYHVEDYENDRKGRKNGEFIRYLYIIKILCGLEGKIKKSNKIIISTIIEPIDKQGKEFVEKIKKEEKEKYHKYILYDETNSLTDQLFLTFYLHTLEYDEDEVMENFTEIYFNLFPSFTYKEFSKEFKKYDFPFKLENLLEYSGTSTREKTNEIKGVVTVRLDSVLYKTKDKEAIFNDVRIQFNKRKEKS
jgi:hypothetical protein